MSQHLRAAVQVGCSMSPSASQVRCAQGAVVYSGSHGSFVACVRRKVFPLFLHRSDPTGAPFGPCRKGALAPGCVRRADGASSPHKSASLYIDMM